MIIADFPFNLTIKINMADFSVFRDETVSINNGRPENEITVFCADSSRKEEECKNQQGILIWSLKHLKYRFVTGANKGLINTYLQHNNRKIGSPGKLV